MGFENNIIIRFDDLCCSHLLNLDDLFFCNRIIFLAVKISSPHVQ